MVVQFCVPVVVFVYRVPFFTTILFGKLFFRWCHAGFFLFSISAKQIRFGAWNIDETNKFQARVCDTQFRYDVFMPVFFFPVAGHWRIEITKLNQDCNLWECCSACFQVASGSFGNQKWWWFDRSFQRWLKNRARNVTKGMPQQKRLTDKQQT